MASVEVSSNALKKHQPAMPAGPSESAWKTPLVAKLNGKDQQPPNTPEADQPPASSAPKTVPQSGENKENREEGWSKKGGGEGDSKSGSEKENLEQMSRNNGVKPKIFDNKNFIEAPPPKVNAWSTRTAVAPTVTPTTTTNPPPVEKKPKPVEPVQNHHPPIKDEGKKLDDSMDWPALLEASKAAKMEADAAPKTTSTRSPPSQRAKSTGNVNGGPQVKSSDSGNDEDSAVEGKAPGVNNNAKTDNKKKIKWTNKTRELVEVREHPRRGGRGGGRGRGDREPNIPPRRYRQDRERKQASEPHEGQGEDVSPPGSAPPVVRQPEAMEAGKPASTRGGNSSRSWRDDMRPLSPLSDKGHDRGPWTGYRGGGWRGARGGRGRGRGPRHQRAHVPTTQQYDVAFNYPDTSFASGDPPFFVPSYLAPGTAVLPTAVPGTVVTPTPDYPFYQVSPDAVEMMEKIRTQVEYYFSEDNLQRDFFLRRQMNEGGWIAVSLVANFHRLKILLQDDLEKLLAAATGSEIVEISPDQQFVRARVNPDRWPIFNSPIPAFSNLNVDSPEFYPGKPFQGHIGKGIQNEEPPSSTPDAAQSLSSQAQSTVPSHPQPEGEEQVAVASVHSSSAPEERGCWQEVKYKRGGRKSQGATPSTKMDETEEANNHQDIQ